MRFFCFFFPRYKLLLLNSGEKKNKCKEENSHLSVGYISSLVIDYSLFIKEESLNKLFSTASVLGARALGTPAVSNL